MERLKDMSFSEGMHRAYHKAKMTTAHDRQTAALKRNAMIRQKLIATLVMASSIPLQIWADDVWCGAYSLILVVCGGAVLCTKEVFGWKGEEGK